MQDTPKDLDKKRADEKLLVSEMIALYCRRQHKTPKGTLCPECRQLLDYALMRIDKCPFMETKTFCSACRVHCYQPAMREKIRTVMRWAGPRMLPVHPVLSVKHVAVTCDVCECSHNVSGCKCELPQIKVTEQCTCNTQQVETPHYCQNYEKK